MKHHVKQMIAKGVKSADPECKINGYPILGPDDAVPTTSSIYALNPLRNSNPNAIASDVKMPFLRKHPTIEGVERMKDDCIYPVRIKELQWDNFLQYNYRFHAHYCDLEGIARSDDMAWIVLIYIFYGKYFDKKKDWPIIRCLHYKTMSGRSRLVNAEFAVRLLVHLPLTLLMHPTGSGNMPQCTSTSSLKHSRNTRSGKSTSMTWGKETLRPSTWCSSRRVCGVLGLICMLWERKQWTLRSAGLLFEFGVSVKLTSHAYAPYAKNSRIPSGIVIN